MLLFFKNMQSYRKVGCSVGDESQRMEAGGSYRNRIQKILAVVPSNDRSLSARLNRE